MRFAQPFWLFGTATAALVAVILIVGGILSLAAIRRFGEESRVRALLTDVSGGRRTFKGALLVAAVALGFVALAQPQYGRGTRTIPATDLDVVIALDFSKSMYARDITPSRIDRAKAEVGRLISQLRGARFGAVAFAGEPMSFPLTTDGAAIAQFFRQLDPSEMPVGGTAIARAMQAARELIARDPQSSTHQRVIVLITDGEDLAGNPVDVAKELASENTVVHVVQIGGRTPEPIPEMDGTGDVVGWRTDSEGAPLTTSLTAEGETQLTEIAEATRGHVVRSGEGQTGIETISAELRRMMKEELAETVETIFADIYHYPLALCVLLLILESLIPETRRRRATRQNGVSAKVASTALMLLLSTGCGEQFDKLFERHAPEVDQALRDMDAGKPIDAVGLLQRYLSTGDCQDGTIGTPPRLTERPNASFNLGLGLFMLAEEFGQRFGEEPTTEQSQLSEQQAADRGARIDCALLVVNALAADRSLPSEQRARARYLAGNLRMLRGEFRNAVEEFDAALSLVPGVPEDAGISLGRDAAHNRAIALRKAKEKEPDGGQPDGGQPDGGQPDGGQPDGGQQDGGGSQPEGDDAAQDASDGQPPQQQREPPQDQSPGANQPQQAPPTASQDNRILDMLEQAPTLQEHSAKKRGARATYPNMEDK